MTKATKKGKKRNTDLQKLYTVICFLTMKNKIVQDKTEISIFYDHTRLFDGCFSDINLSLIPFIL